MKIILTKEIKELGTEGEIKNVSDGYARNYLLPRKSAVLATERNLSIWEQKRKEIEVRLANEKKEKEELASKLSALSIMIMADAGEEGKLFGSVTSSDIAKEILSNSGIEIDRRDIDLPGNIKNIGSYTVSARLHPEVSAKISIEVKAKK